MMNRVMHQSVILAVILLVTLVVLAATLIVNQPASEPICGPGSSVPLMPLGVDYPYFRLRAYGRSTVQVVPRAELCISLDWEAYADSSVIEDFLLLIELVGDDNGVVSCHKGPLAPDLSRWLPGADPTEWYPVQIAEGTASGCYRINITILSAESEAIIPTLDGRKTLTIGLVYVLTETQEEGS